MKQKAELSVQRRAVEVAVLAFALMIAQVGGFLYLKSVANGYWDPFFRLLWPFIACVILLIMKLVPLRKSESAHVARSSRLLLYNILLWAVSPLVFWIAMVLSSSTMVLLAGLWFWICYPIALFVHSLVLVRVAMLEG